MIMNEFTVDSNQLKIDFGAEGISEIIQNVKMILTTIAFTIPMDRDFARDIETIDAPVNVAKAQQTANIVEAILKYEPRAEVINIEFETDILSGELKPIVRVRINETTI